jgi:hypothetical protein
MNFKKKFCVLQVTPELPNEQHLSYFKDKVDSDFYFVTHDSPHKDSLKFCPNTTWAETRNTLCEMVPKEYEYYAFIDYDYILRPQKKLAPLDQILEDLEYNPAVLTYYPGNNMQTPYASDKSYFGSRDYSCIPFTHAGLKIVHHSLLRWFFPLCTDFSVDIDACHMFNIQEIPFLKNVICSHKMIYDNGVSNDEAEYNQDGAYSKYKMDQMWKWIYPSLKVDKMLNLFARRPEDKNDSLLIKRTLVDLFNKKQIIPEKSPSNINYYNLERVQKVFNLEHEFFTNKPSETERQFEKLNENLIKKVESKLRENVTFESLKKKNNPWIKITSDVNSDLNEHRNITVNECVDIFQNMQDNKSLFINNSLLNKELRNYLNGKRVAFVGPAPYLMNKGKGKLIDEYDVVVRVQTEIPNTQDYGSRTDIIQSCLNSNYSPGVANFLEKTSKEDRPKFIICNDTVAREYPNPGSGKWLSTLKEYEDYLEEYEVPLAHLKNDDDTWDRWALYWEIYPKEHIEKIDKGVYTYYSSNFNSGYGALNMLMSCPLKELAVFGMTFYNFGVVKSIKDKYNNDYISAQGKDGTYLGPDKILHDQISQMNHCISVLDRDPRFKMDPEIKSGLFDPSLQKRIQKFKKLPKFKNETE